jgi:hypothetical protein
LVSLPSSNGRRVGLISSTVIIIPCHRVLLASSSFKHPVPTGLTTLTAGMVRVVAHAVPMATISTVHKSPSLTIVENWLATVVSTVALTVSRTICFRVRSF